MSKNRISSETEIAPGFTVSEWMYLRERLRCESELDREEAWTRAIGAFKERVEHRFLAPMRRIRRGNRARGEGFAIVSLACILIEFLQAFRSGKCFTHSREPGPNEYNSSRELFEEFMGSVEPFATDVAACGGAKGFYDNVRCGLLHEGRTRGDYCIRMSGNALMEVEGDGSQRKTIVYRNNLLDALERYFDGYERELKSDESLRDGFVRKMDELCDLNRS